MTYEQLFHTELLDMFMISLASAFYVRGPNVPFSYNHQIESSYAAAMLLSYTLQNKSTVKEFAYF
jgi:hypothetical protein